MGNLTKDPEIRYTSKGTAVGSIGMAINDTFKDAQGNVKETVTFIDVIVWGRAAENCKQYLAKGRPVFVEGRLQLDQWEKDGEKKTKLTVKADRVQFLGTPSDTSRPAQRERPTHPMNTDPANIVAEEEDSIPF